MSNRTPYLESPLSSVAANFESVSAAGRDLLLRETPAVGFLCLRGDTDDIAYTDGIRRIFGVAPPKVPTEYRELNQTRIYGIGPDEWLAVLPENEVAETEAELRRQLTGHCAIVDVSGGYILLSLCGPAAEEVLHKSGVYDFDRRNFVVGRSVQTILAATNALISRTGDEAFDLVIRRSFADHIARWIIDAGAEYGISIDVSGCTDKDVS